MPKSREQVRLEYAKKFGLFEFLEDDHKAVLKISDDLYTRCAKSKSINKHSKKDSIGWMKGRFSIEDIDRATAKGECVIDKVEILSFPLNDSRTSPTLRKIYLEQEELMIELAKIEREESREYEDVRLGISSEVLYGTRVYYWEKNETNISSDTVIAVRGLKDISKENLAISQANNKVFLDKTLGVVPEGFCTQLDTQLCSECSCFNTGACQ